MKTRAAMRAATTCISGAFAALGLAGSLTAQTPGIDGESYRIEARGEVLSTIRAALSTLGDRDVAAHRALFLPSATVIAVVEREGERTVRVQTLEESINSIAAVTVPMNERIWDPEVRVDGGIAIAWAPYDFYIDGGFSHCGHDAFQLIRTDLGWKLSSITYTIQQPPDCTLHPDGPPLGATSVR